MAIDVSVQRPEKDPLLQCDFLIEIDGIGVAGFMEFTEPQKSKGHPEYREGNMANRPHKQLGLEKISDITLKRGIFTGENVLYEWYQSGTRKSIDIVFLKHGRDGDRRVKTLRSYECQAFDYKHGKGDALSEDGKQIAEIMIHAEDWDEV